MKNKPKLVPSVMRYYRLPFTTYSTQAEIFDMGCDFNGFRRVAYIGRFHEFTGINGEPMRVHETSFGPRVEVLELTA